MIGWLSSVFGGGRMLTPGEAVLELVLGAALCTGAGLLAGRQFLAIPEPSAQADEAAEAEPTSFSPVTLQNLGVTVGPIEPSAYTRTLS